jgi:hypothetical protein
MADGIVSGRGQASCRTSVISNPISLILAIMPCNSV